MGKLKDKRETIKQRAAGIGANALVYFLLICIGFVFLYVSLTLLQSLMIDVCVIRIVSCQKIRDCFVNCPSLCGQHKKAPM